MRFADDRQTLTKNVDTPDRERSATPRMLSPYMPDGFSVREGVAASEIPRPQPNRGSRRAAGNTKPRTRIAHGVALPLPEMPWKGVLA